MIKIYQINDIFNIHTSLTKHLKELWGISKPTWTDSKSYWFVVYYNNEWIGYGGCRYHSESCLYFGPTFVKCEFRGQGLQVKLIKRRLNFAKKKGVNKIISSTFTNNYPSCNNLIKCGFKLYKGWLENPEKDSLYWFKKL